MSLFAKKNPYRLKTPHLKPQHDSGVDAKKIIRILVASTIIIAIFVLIDNYSQWQEAPPNAVTWNIIGVTPDKTVLAIKSSTKELLSANFMDIDLSNLNAKIKENPWVASADISRQFWLKIAIVVRIKTAVLRMNSGGYIDSQGQYFLPKYTLSNNLPLAVGKQKNSQKIYQNYQKYQQILGQEFPIQVIKQSEVTQLIVGNNTTLKLGYNQQKQRLKKFIYLADKLREKQGSLNHLTIDLRYAKGLVVKK